ncbi:glycosyltransferase family 92 protein [Shimia sp. R10_1]|uniref:glycosyltransferase family 92 protein n=1 Tax=Shimia sp. R10_1 TaxID=2821095 RepID=UPI001ADAB73F|nr:glycosyltransferase family 92 protein [Shimia sp. R10_1]MBO9472166.1 glycosyltransferase family 92 protein [Shimia sp. R10_1]
MKWFFSKPRKKGRASRISIKPPMAAAGRHGVALVTIAKNEEKRIADWLTFHALAGVREVILYDNKSTDRTAEIASKFSGLKVTVIPWQLHTETSSPAMVLPRQILAYCHAISTFGERFRWMSMIDLDEYIVPKDTLTIEDALKPLEAHSNISLPWVMFGHNGHQSPTTTPIPFGYTERARHQSGPLLNFKCIIDPCQVTKVSVHKFETVSMGKNSANTLGRTASNKTRKSESFVTNDVLQLNHYYLLSQQDTEEKINRGAVSGVSNDTRSRSLREKQKLIEAEPVSDTSALDFLSRHGIFDANQFADTFRG